MGKTRDEKKGTLSRGMEDSFPSSSQEDHLDQLATLARSQGFLTSN